MKTAEYWSGDIAIPPLGLELATSAYRDYVIGIIEQVQSDAIESTVRKCADVAYNPTDSTTWSSSPLVIRSAILSLIPQKEKKV